MRPNAKDFIGLKAHYKKIGKTKRSRLVDWEAFGIDAFLLVQLVELLPEKMTLDPPIIFPQESILRGLPSTGDLKVGRSQFYTLGWITQGYCRCWGLPFVWKGEIPLNGFVDFSEFDKKFVLEIMVTYTND